MSKPQTSGKTRVPLSKERVLTAAVELADRVGFEALTIRKLAEELGVGTMSLYHYFANKDELLDGMVEIVFSEIAVPSTEVDWKTAMRARAVSGREVLARHRWANGHMESRLHPGPANLELHNAVLGCLREAGFSIELAIHANSVLDAYGYGFALQEASLPFDSHDELTDVIDEQVRHIEEDTDMADFAQAFPYLAEAVVDYITQTGFEFGAEFEYGLELILDGLEQRLAEDSSRRA